MQSELKWASLHGHDFLSLQDGLSSPLDNFSRAIDGNLSGLAITNHGNLSSTIKVLKSRKQYIDKIKTQIEKSDDNQVRELLEKKIDCAKKVKLIIGNEMYLAMGEKENVHLVVLAKNLDGYKKLIKATSESTKRENFYRKPRLNFDQLASYVGNLIVINGHPGSSLYSKIWTDVKASFNVNTYEEARQLVHSDWRKRVLDEAGKFREVFGDNFYLESQLIDVERLPAARVAVNIYRWLSKQLNIKIVATSDSHYPTQDRCDDHRVLIANLLKTTIPKIERQLAYDEDDVGMSGFFKSDRYYLPTTEEIYQLHPEEEIKTTLEITESIEEYDLFNKPFVPIFDCPDGMNSNEYMTYICRQGWQARLHHLKGEDKKLYADRIKGELSTLQGVGLSDYFLLVRDIIEYVKSEGGFVGVSRGSAGGCLASYLMGLIALDPIEHDLPFERFYNIGRCDLSKGHIEYPDFDLDIEPSYREKVIKYLKNKYGNSKVSQISTYGRMMGRSALSDVLRVKECMSFDEIKKCTSLIPDEAAISDALQEMREEGIEPSIIRWSLENNADGLREWCWLNNKGECEGPYADYFSQAIRLENTYRNVSKHAAGIIVMPFDITDIMPVIYDKEGNSAVAFDLKDSEFCGALKLDILGVDILSRIKDAQFSVKNEFLRDLHNEEIS